MNAIRSRRFIHFEGCKLFIYCKFVELHVNIVLDFGIVIWINLVVVNSLLTLTLKRNE